MNFRDRKGSITIFVLVGLLFMSGFLIISFGSNINKSKIAKEQFDILSGIYSHGDGDKEAYERAYTAIRKRNAQTLTYDSEKKGLTSVSTVELTKTFNDKLSEFKIYGNSIQDGTPSPTNPVEVQSVGDKTENILAFSYGSKSQETNGGKLTVNPDASITASGTPTGYIGVTLYSGKLINSSTNSITVSLNGDCVNTNIITNLLDDANNNVQSFVARLDSPQTIDYSLYPTATKMNITYRRNSNNIEMSGTGYPMVVEGITALPYEPYGKYKIPVKVSGKNLLNPDTVKDVNKYIYITTGKEFTPSATGGTWRASDYISISAGKTYHLNAINNNATAAGMAWYDINKEFISGINTTTVNKNNGNITAPENAHYVRISWRIDEGYNPNWQYTVQLEEGEEETEYMSYVESKTFDIYVEEPLRKVGDFADYIDFTTGKIVRNNVRNITLKVSDMNNYEEYPGWKNVQYIKEDLGSEIDLQLSRVVNGFSNISKLDTIRLNTNGTNSTVYFIVSSFNLTQTQWKAQYSDLEINILYGLGTVTEEIIDLPELKTFEDYTKIEVLTDVAPSKIEATYYGYTME